MSITEIFAKLFEFLKLNAKYAFAIMLCAGILVFIPTQITDKLGMTQFIDQNRGWLGITFLLSACILLSSLVFSIARIVWDKVIARRIHRERLKYLESLTDGEKAIVSRYMDEKTRTQYLPIDDGDVVALRVQHIIYQASNVGHLEAWAFNMYPWFYDYLIKHPELYELPPGSDDGGTVSRSRRRSRYSRPLG